MQFKKLTYGGVSVQRRVIPNSESNRVQGKTRKERRTLWLMLPEVGSLKLGFVSKLSDGDATAVSNKSSTGRAKQDMSESSLNENEVGTVASEEVTLDSALIEKDTSNLGRICNNSNVQLSLKHLVALTDETALAQDPNVEIKFKPRDQTEYLRVISVQDVSGTSLLFLANYFWEAELLYCGLTARLGVRGSLPISTLGGGGGGEGSRGIHVT